MKSLVAAAMDVFVALRAGGAYPLIDSEVLLRGGGPYPLEDGGPAEGGPPARDGARVSIRGGNSGDTLAAVGGREISGV